MVRSMASVSCFGGTRSRATKHCLSGRRSSRSSTRAVGLREMCPPSDRIWRSSSLQNGFEIAIHHRLLLGDAQPGIDQRHEGDEARHAVRRVAIARREIAELRRERVQERLVGLRVARIEHHHRVGQPGDHPPPDDLRLPGEAAHRLRSLTKSLDQRLGLLARQLAARGAQMPEPAEAVKLARPPFGRRRDLEGRLRRQARPGGRRDRNGRCRSRWQSSDRRCVAPGAQAAAARLRVPDKQTLAMLAEHEAAKRARPARKLSARPALAGKRVSRHAQSSRILGPRLQIRRPGPPRKTGWALSDCSRAGSRALGA